METADTIKGTEEVKNSCDLYDATMICYISCNDKTIGGHMDLNFFRPLQRPVGPDAL